jgi:acetyl-CoA/propionyl-CoA carboxylase biotin carboxyl carrier protein
MPLFDRVLVANRGEIACRVFRTLRRLGIGSVAVYSDADARARHVREADVAVRIGPAAARASYLNIAAVVDAARQSGAQAVHPGDGFLAENAEFARAVIAAGLVWVGPPPEAIDAMGDKISAKLLVSGAGVPVVPGRTEPGMTDAALAAAAREIGWPVLIKPSAGGGGKGMHVVTGEAELLPALQTARREAAASFGDDTLFVERYVASPRHIEVQVLADTQGAVVHLGERECSLQRRHQKVVEEAPSVLLDADTRARISADAPDEFFFMEMNTRLQVEHPVTELVTGLDLVEQQLLVAAGQPLGFTQADVTLTGHAVEARVYAEDPALGFLPTTGRVHVLREPNGDGIRVDSALLAGQPVATDYDPMLAKVVAVGADRDQALHRLDAALAHTVILGVTTNVGFLRRLLAEPAVRSGELDTGLIERSGPFAAAPPEAAYAVAALHALATERRGAGPWERTDGWRLGGVRAPRRFRFESPDGGDAQTVAVVVGAESATVRLADGEPMTAVVERYDAESITLSLSGQQLTAYVAIQGTTTWVHVLGEAWELRAAPPPRLRGGQGGPAAVDELRSPMPGTVIAVPVSPGDEVGPGAPVIVVEAMKMEHAVTAPAAGRVAEILVAPGDGVAKDQVLARLDHAPT